jgi:hypothetical protein
MLIKQAITLLRVENLLHPAGEESRSWEQEILAEHYDEGNSNQTNSEMV